MKFTTSLRPVTLGFLAASSVFSQAAPRLVGTLELDHPMERSLARGEVDVFTIEAGKGQFLRVIAEQRGIDVSLAIVDPSGRELLSMDSPNGTSGLESIAAVVQRPGKHQITVSGLSVAHGTYSIRLTASRLPSGKDQMLLRAQASLCAAVALKDGDAPAIWSSAMKKLADAVEIWRALGESYQQALSQEILGSMAVHLEEWDKAFSHYEQALSMWRGLNSIDVSFLNRLADLYDRREVYEKAEPLYVEAIAIARKVFGTEHHEVALCLTSLGVFYQARGRYAEAEPLYVESLAIVKKLFGAEHADTATATSNLAILYDKQDRFKEAEPLAVEALTIRKKLLGEEHADTADSLDVLAGVYRGQGRYVEAEPLFVSALTLRRKLLGAENSATADTINNLAILYEIQGRYSEAQPLFVEGLAISRSVSGPNHPDTAISLRNLAELYDKQGLYAEAEHLFIDALAILKKTLGAANPITILTLSDLGTLYRERGLYGQAEALFVEALAARKKALGPESHDTSVSMNDLAMLYEVQGRYREAETFFIEALAIVRKTRGPGTTDAAKSMNNLAGLYREQGRYAEAESLSTEALAMFKKLSGPEHPDTAAALDRLARIYESQGRHEAAEPFVVEALAIRKKVLGLEHPDTATSMNNLALVYRSQSRYAEAESLFSEALAIVRRVLGPVHRFTATGLHNLAAVYEAQGRDAEAEQFYSESLEIVRTTLGPEHADTAEDLDSLALLYQAQGRYSKAQELMTQALRAHSNFVQTNLPSLPERAQKDFVRLFSGARNGYLTAAVRPGAPVESLELGAATNRLFKGLRLGAQQELFARVRREGGMAGEQLLASLRDLTNQIGAANEAGAKPEFAAGLRTQRHAVEVQLLQLAGYRQLTQQPSAEDVQKTLPAAAALVDIAYYQQLDPKKAPGKRSGAWRYAAFVYLPDALHLVDLGPAEGDNGIEPLLSRAQGMEARLWSGNHLKPAASILADQRTAKVILQVLDAKILGPIRKTLGPERYGEIKHWIISPDGNLGFLPWEMLLNEQGRYLIETSLVSYAESPRALVYPNIGVSANQAVAFLNPQYDRTVKAPPAASAAPRISGKGNTAPLYQGALAQRFREANPRARLVSWQDATEAALMTINGPRNLLVWTHGEFKDKADDPLEKPQILLAGSKQGQSPTKAYSGYVTARKMMNTNLHGTQLAVIAGCETGYGSPDAGEGLEGMRRALWVAGSGSQLLTLWPVADRYTVRWLELFYEELRKPGMTRIQAVANVQRMFISGHVTGEGIGEEQIHPYFWAPFTLSGIWGKIQ